MLSQNSKCQMGVFIDSRVWHSTADSRRARKIAVLVGLDQLGNVLHGRNRPTLLAADCTLTRAESDLATDAALPVLGPEAPFVFQDVLRQGGTNVACRRGKFEYEFPAAEFQVVSM